MGKLCGKLQPLCPSKVKPVAFAFSRTLPTGWLVLSVELPSLLKCTGRFRIVGCCQQGLSSKGLRPGLLGSQ